MPYTPYHLGPAIFLGLLFLSFIDFPTFIIGGIIVDIEQFLNLVLNLDYPIHGIFHSIFDGTFVAIPLAVLRLKIRDKLTPLLSFLRLEQKISFRRILVG